MDLVKPGDTIGFIGLGIMGKPMSENLIKAGFNLLVHNRTRTRADEILEMGAQWRDSPIQLARECDVLVTMLSDSLAVRDVVLGEKGISKGISKGGVVIDMSTISPKATMEISEKLGELNVSLIDAPVSGGVAGARQGSLSIMVGGDEDVFQLVVPALEAMGSDITYMGGSGSGQETKLVNQIMVAVNQNGVAEALVFAEKAGLDPNKVIEACKGGGAGSFQLQNQGPRMIEGDYSPGFMVKHMEKDLGLVSETSEDIISPLPFTSLASQFYRALMAEGKSEYGTQAIHSVIRRLNSIEPN